MPGLDPALSADCSCSCPPCPSSSNLPIRRGSRGVRSVIAPFLPFAQKRSQFELLHQNARLVVKCSALRDPLLCTNENASLYAVLGLEQDVSHAEIKSAYRQMARRYHPDVCGASEKEESIHKFLQVQEAYEILSDGERRADYDYGLLHPFCAQALGRGFSSDMEMKGRRRKGAQDGVSVAWKLQWEAQLWRLKLRQQHKCSCAAGSESWGAKLRRENCSPTEACAEKP